MSPALNGSRPEQLDVVDAQQGQATWKIVSTVFFNLIVYVLIGLPLAGFLISLQYAATLVTRSIVGRLSDARGPKSAVLMGLICASVSGCCILEASLHLGPVSVLIWLAASRLWLGTAESGTGTGCITWGIGRAGAVHTASVISWNGVASYGGIAAGAPVGVFLYHLGGLQALAATTIGLPILGLVFCVITHGTPVIPGVRMGFAKVVRQMFPYGMCLALGSVGFGTIVAFVTLFYANHGWINPAYALSGFGAAFVSVRLLLSGTIRRFGGFKASIVSFAVEFCGLIILWMAPTPIFAIIGAALTGFGFSLIFPAMAVEALKIIPRSNRGAAIGVYTVFLDLSLGITGPLAGLVIGRFGYPSVYLLAAIAVAFAELLTLKLLITTRSSTFQEKCGVFYE